MRLLLGDLRDVLPTLEPASFDAVVTDPPYELGFMGKAWDRSGVAFQPETWEHVLRVLKPGGFLLSFGGTRTYHRIAVAIEDAGFEVRDQIVWLYGQGFPKSLDASKAIDARLGAEREVVGTKVGLPGYSLSQCADPGGVAMEGNVDGSLRDPEAECAVTAPATDEARRWQGWGTALKPAMEPVVVARKPLVGTVAANLLEHGVGALNIDATRIGTTKDVPASARRAPQGAAYGDLGNARGDESGFDPHVGRWPANVVLSHTADCVLLGTRRVSADGHWPAARPAGSDIAGAPGHAGQDELAERYADGETAEVWDCAPDCPVRMLNEQTGDVPSTGSPSRPAKPGKGTTGGYGGALGLDTQGPLYADAGGASRFFYVAKASRAERNAGLGEDFEARALRWSSGDQSPGTFQGAGTDRSARNDHPTVKPIGVMRWLLRLVTPPGGVVLDPFLGSGSTGCAAVLEGVDIVGVELDRHYLRIAGARMRFWGEHGEDGLRVVAERDRLERVRRDRADAGQLDLFGEPR